MAISSGLQLLGSSWPTIVSPLLYLSLSPSLSFSSLPPYSPSMVPVIFNFLTGQERDKTGFPSTLGTCTLAKPASSFLSSVSGPPIGAVVIPEWVHSVSTQLARSSSFSTCRSDVRSDSERGGFLPGAANSVSGCVSPALITLVPCNFPSPRWAIIFLFLGRGGS